MNRREFLGTMAAAPMALHGTRMSATRTFEISTKIELEETHDGAVVWVPLPLARRLPFQVDRGHIIGGNADKAETATIAPDTRMIVAEWGHTMPPPVLTVMTRVETTDHRVAIDRPNGAKRTAELPAYLKPTKLIPLDGIVRQTSDAVTRNHATALAKARAISMDCASRPQRSSRVLAALVVT